MSYTPSEISIDEWRKGIPLPQAPLRFANRQQKEHHSELRDKVIPFHLKIQKLTKQVNRSDQVSKTPSEIMAPLYEGRENDSALSDHKRRLQVQLTNWLRNDVLSAYGFETPRSSTDPARKIPPDLWFTRDQWSSETVSGHGLKFVGVRVFAPNWLVRDPDKPETAGPGRPGISGIALEEFESALSRDEVDPTKPLAKVARTIQALLKQKYPDQKGLGDRAVENALRSRLKELNEKHV